MKTYELSYIVSPEMTSEEAEAKAKEIESAIQSREGVILKQSNPVAKTLAYPIAKRASGFFGILEFQLEPEKLLELKEIIVKDKKIVRHMVVVKEPVRIRKERRSRIKAEPAFTIERKEPEVEVKTKKIEEIEEAKTEEKVEVVEKKEKEKEKVELKDIEEKLDEILGE